LAKFASEVIDYSFPRSIDEDSGKLVYGKQIGTYDKDDKEALLSLALFNEKGKTLETYKTNGNFDMKKIKKDYLSTDEDLPDSFIM
jgi:hypothetical protein